MTRIKLPLLRLVAVCAVAACSVSGFGRAHSADYWSRGNAAALSSKSDCGVIVAVHGSPVVRRAFHDDGGAGAPVHPADRISSGDELSAPGGSRIEMTGGNNILLVLGPGAKVRLNGVRDFVDPDGNAASRLDLEVLAGEVRVQVRANRTHPEALLASLGGCEALVRRGDVVLQAGWRVSALTGNAFARTGGEGAFGAAFAVPERHSVDGNGEREVDAAGMAAMMGRMPFSFESLRAALPPTPLSGTYSDAP